MTYEGHRRTVGGDRRLTIYASGETWGNLTKCGATEGLTVHPVKSSLSLEIVPVPEVEENLSME